MKSKLLIIALLVAVSACTNADKATRALESSGFKDIEITGYRWTGCGKDDTFQTGFQARGANGSTVTGVVCSDWFKGSTVRLD